MSLSSKSQRLREIIFPSGFAVGTKFTIQAVKLILDIRPKVFNIHIKIS